MVLVAKIIGAEITTGGLVVAVAGIGALILGVARNPSLTS